MIDTFRLGDLTIRAIMDFPDQEWPAELLIPSSRPELLKGSKYAPRETYNPETGGLRLKFGGYLFETSGRVILVDCGIGASKSRSPHPDWDMREDAAFLDSLQGHGYRPDDIDIVIITHAHVDHVGWLTVRNPAEGWDPTFPNAEHIFTRAELDYFLHEHKSDPGVNFGSTDDSIVPLIGRVNITRAEDGHQPAPGVTIRIYPGHTPGNAAVWLESRGKTAVVCGDTIHHPIQLRYPDWSSGFCLDPDASAAGRRRLLDQVAERGSFLIPNHFRLEPVKIAKIADHYEFASALF